MEKTLSNKVAQVQCSHCRQEYDFAVLNAVNINGEDLYFCCSGCALAYELLKENNLESFYAKLGNTQLQTKKVLDSINNINYDSISFKEKYIKEVSGKKRKRKVTKIIESKTKDSINLQNLQLDSKKIIESKITDSIKVSKNIESRFNKTNDFNNLDSKNFNKLSNLDSKENIESANDKTDSKKTTESNDEYITLKEVHFILDGAMCAACVWLNEQILHNLNGIENVAINYTTFKAKVQFYDDEISLKEIIQAIQNIGYNAIIYDPSDKESSVTKRNNKYYIKLVVAIFCTMNIMWVNVGQYTGLFSGIDAISSNILNLASFILATPVLFFCASGFYKAAFKGAKNGVIGMETLVITGSTLVYLYSIFAWLSGSGHTYFEGVCMIILFVLSAKFLESLSRKKAGDNLLRLNSILPLSARLFSGEIISVHDVKKGDLLLVLPGEILACDGVLESESGSFDYSNISGEAMPLNLVRGEAVSSGAIAINNAVMCRVVREFEHSSLSKLASLLRNSEFSTPPIASFAFRISGVFSRIVLSIAAVGFLFYFFTLHAGFEHSLLIAVSVIVIACPCALALATPIASVVGLNVSFRNNIIFTKASFLESLSKANIVIFDKTGTLTQGKMRVIKAKRLISPLLCGGGRGGEIKAESSLDSILKKAMQKNPHIIAKAILQHLDSINDTINDIESSPLDTFEILQGKGFRAFINNVELIGGNKNFMLENNVDSTQSMESSEFKNVTKLYIAMKLDSKNFTLTHIFCLQDSVKSGANTLIEYLQRAKKRVIMLSGDRFDVVQDLANKLKINEFHAEFTPLKKAEFIKNMIENSPDSKGFMESAFMESKNPAESANFIESKTPADSKNKKNIIVMIGDGLNDSLALKYAQIGIAMGSASDISINQSDVIILDDRLETLQKAFKIANLTFAHIKQNLVMSLCYNALAIPFALCGYVIPLFAAAFMSLSSLCVVLNSLRLYKSKI